MTGLFLSQKRDAEVDAGFEAGFMSSDPYVEPVGPLTPYEVGFRHGVKASNDMLAQVFGEPEAERKAS